MASTLANKSGRSSLDVPMRASRSRRAALASRAAPASVIPSLAAWLATLFMYQSPFVISSSILACVASNPTANGKPN